MQNFSVASYATVSFAECSLATLNSSLVTPLSLTLEICHRNCLMYYKSTPQGCGGLSIPSYRYMYM